MIVMSAMMICIIIIIVVVAVVIMIHMTGSSIGVHAGMRIIVVLMVILVWHGLAAVTTRIAIIISRWGVVVVIIVERSVLWYIG